MKANDDKCQLLLSSPDDSSLIQIENSTIKSSKTKKLLGVHIDYKLKFDIHKLFVKKLTENLVLFQE